MPISLSCRVLNCGIEAELPVMSDSLLVVLWPLSASLAVIVGIRIGLRWRGNRDSHGDEAGPSRRHGDGGMGDHGGSLGIGERQTDRDSPPAELSPRPWPNMNAKTDVLPRVQDIRPPTRATPIRRPPWV